MPDSDSQAQAPPMRRRLSDRRHGIERRNKEREKDSVIVASWRQQRTQCLTRYLFFALGLLYFNLIDFPASSWVSLSVVNLCLFLYAFFVTLTLLHARKILNFPWRWRLAMWVDLCLVSFTVLSDPVALSPAYIAYVMIILGNGLRYGQRFFAETVGASLIFGAITSLFRFYNAMPALNISAVFSLLFGCLIVLYAYHLTAELERARKRLEQVSHRDELTGLFNRRGLYDKAETLFQQLQGGQQEITILFADLDKFKAVNDVLGHPTGDQVLADIAKLFARQLRSSDVLGRVGGDEFVFILPNTGMDPAVEVATRVQQALVSWAQRASLDLSVSIGLGTAPEHGLDFQEVLTHVDLAMYRAKGDAANGGIVCVDNRFEQPQVSFERSSVRV